MQEPDGNAYDTCKSQMEMLESRITQTNEDIKALKEEIKKTYTTPKKNSEQDSVTENEVEEEKMNEDDEDDLNYFDDPKNVFEDDDDLDGHEGVDGGRSLSDSEVGLEEQID